MPKAGLEVQPWIFLLQHPKWQGLCAGTIKPESFFKTVFLNNKKPFKLTWELNFNYLTVKQLIVISWETSTVFLFVWKERGYCCVCVQALKSWYKLINWDKTSPDKDLKDINGCQLKVHKLKTLKKCPWKEKGITEWKWLLGRVFHREHVCV